MGDGLMAEVERLLAALVDKPQFPDGALAIIYGVRKDVITDARALLARIKAGVGR